VRRLGWGLLIVSALVLAPPTRPAAPDPYPIQPPPPTLPKADFLSVSTDHPYARDRPLLATVSPNGDGYRDFVDIRFFLATTARVTLRAQATRRTFQRVIQPAWIVRRRMYRGWQSVRWRPARDLEPSTYAIVLALESGDRGIRYGRLTRDSLAPPAPIVRVLQVDASFDRSSYAPGETAQLSVASDASGLTVRIADVAGADVQPTVSRLDGPDVVEPQKYPWEANRDNGVNVPITIGAWKPGMYFAIITNDAGDVGYAPFIVKAAQPTSRVAVLMADQTWFAYDFYDGDRDGFPDGDEFSRRLWKVGRSIWRPSHRWE